jgi:hypothetical protein
VRHFLYHEFSSCMLSLASTNIKKHLGSA